MKKKVWVIPPIFYVMDLLLFAYSITAYKDHKLLFTAEITLAGIIFVFLLLLNAHFHLHVKESAFIAKKILTAEETDNLNKLQMGVVVCGDSEDIIWANEYFIHNFASKKNPTGSSIKPFISPKSLLQVISDQYSDITYKDKMLTVYSLENNGTTILFFIDNTYYKRVSRAYRERKTVISLISFDNKDEVLRNASGGDESRITAEVEYILRNWAVNEMDGFMRSLSGERYLMVSDMVHIEAAQKNHFEVLKKIHQVKGPGNLSCTVSIGVGKASKTIAESEEGARRALDMALGRGGDQVAVLGEEDSFNFYGGLSGGTEKQDKVKARVVSSRIAELVRESDVVYIMGHKNSDLDAVGSAVGMWAAIKNGLNKPCNVVINRNQTLAKSLVELIDREESENVFISPNDALPYITDNTLLIVVDTHSSQLVESRDVLDRCRKTVVIDHHRMNVSHIKDAQVFYHEPYASSASEMVTELIAYVPNFKLNATEAQALLAGIMLDTKNFVIKTGVRTFEASAYLRRRGANTVEVKKLFANSVNLSKEKAVLVTSAEIYRNCAISYTDDYTSDTRVAAAQAADELLSLENVKASFVIFKTDTEVCISGRSLGEVNVQIILEALGGGGHLTMAAAQIKEKSIEEVRISLIAVLDEKLADSTVEEE